MQIIALDPATPQLRAPPSGSTYAAPRAIAMTPETLTGSAATSSLSIAQTWNTTGTPTAIDLNVTDTASNANSLLMDFRRNGTSVFSVEKNGLRVGLSRIFQDAVRLNVNTGEFSIGASSDVRLTRDAADTLAQRRGVNAQAFNVYSSYTDGSNYTRAKLSAASGVVTLAGESAGTGDANIDVTITPKGAGAVRFGTHAALSGETVTGYITIKDAGGTVRKLAVVS